MLINSPATLLHWTVTDRKYGVGCAVALRRINDYLIAARNQIRRIKRCRDKKDRMIADMEQSISQTAWQTLPRRRPTTSGQALQEIHFYFVCWDTIHKMIGFLKDRSGFKVVGDLYKCHRKILKHYSDARDHLEHYRERMEGRKKNENLANSWDMGNLEGYVYTINRERYDAGPVSLKQLEKIVSELNQKVLQEAMPRYQKILEEDR